MSNKIVIRRLENFMNENDIKGSCPNTYQVVSEKSKGDLWNFVCNLIDDYYIKDSSNIMDDKTGYEAIISPKEGDVWNFNLGKDNEWNGQYKFTKDGFRMISNNKRKIEIKND